MVAHALAGNVEVLEKRVGDMGENELSRREVLVYKLSLEMAANWGRVRDECWEGSV